MSATSWLACRYSGTRRGYPPNMDGSIPRPRTCQCESELHMLPPCTAAQAFAPRLITSPKLLHARARSMHAHRHSTHCTNRHARDGRIGRGFSSGQPLTCCAVLCCLPCSLTLTCQCHCELQVRGSARGSTHTVPCTRRA